MLALPHGAAEIGAMAASAPEPGAGSPRGCRGRCGARCRATAMGPMPGPPPPCGMAKVLCRLRWQTSAPDARRRRQADLGIQVGAVHVDLPALLVDGGAHVVDRVLEDAVRRRVGDHQRAEPRGRARPPSPADPRDRRCRPRRRPPPPAAGRAMAALAGLVPWAEGRDQDHIAVALSARPVERPESPAGRRTRPGRPSCGLQRHGVEAGDGAQQRFELLDDPPVAARLRGRCEGMDVAELGPGDRLHLRRRIQLHRARAEGNHRRVEADVLALEPLQIPHHLQARSDGG